MTGEVKEIYIADKGAKPVSQTSVQAEAGKGLVGDRYHSGEGTFSEKFIHRV